MEDRLRGSGEVDGLGKSWLKCLEVGEVKGDASGVEVAEESWETKNQRLEKWLNVFVQVVGLKRQIYL